jgi:soluble lytic murein transglycosylase
VNARFAIAGLLLGAGAVPAAASAPRYWIQAIPQDPAETALREALAKNAFAGPAATAQALQAVSASYPGTATSGLAEFAAGLLFLDAARPLDAEGALRHPDVARTGLPDRALLALGEALESSGDLLGAATNYLAAADSVPGTATLCPALLHAGEALSKAGQYERASAAFDRASHVCPGQEAFALLRLAECLESAHALRAAALAYDHLDRDYPATKEALHAEPRRVALAPLLPEEPIEARRDRAVKRALELFDGSRYAESAAAFRAALRLGLTDSGLDIVHARLGRALLLVGRPREAHAELALVRTGSSYEAEAAYYLARLRAQLTKSPDPFETVVSRFPDSPFAEQALLDLANHYQKDARDAEAVPYYRRLLAGFPNGRYTDRATWRVAWADYREGRYQDAAQLLERAALMHPSPWTSPGFLYWAGRARLAHGDTERGRQLLEEAVQRFKYTYHGLKAKETLAHLPASSTLPTPVLSALNDESRTFLPEPLLSRVRALLLIDRLGAARDELTLSPPSPASQATIAWIDWRLGQLRPAMNAMRRAYPEALGEGGDLLPDEVWRILFPLQYREVLEARATAEGVDPALVAALICQESTFDPGAVSRAGARGLMQVIPRTGMLLARNLRLAWRSQSLFDPGTSVEFGVHYLRQMLDRFGGRSERALAAYNAGPERVDSWTASNPDISAEEFVESIPFTETRNYVMTILGARDQYRRIYSFPAAPAGGGGTARAATRP